MIHMSISDTRGDLQSPTLASAHPLIKFSLPRSHFLWSPQQPNENLREQNNAQTMPISAILKVLSNGPRMRSWHYKSPYQFRPVPVPWYRAVAVFLVCHSMYDVDAPRAPGAHTANSAGRRFTARARSRPGKQTR